MARICISKKRKYPYIKFNWSMDIERSSLGFNKELTARICGFEIKEFNNKYPEYAIQYDKDERGDALIKVHIPANGDTVVGGTITTIKDNATKSENYTTYTTETLSGEECDNLDTIFTARLGGRELSIWRTDDGKLYIHKLQFMYHSDSITRHISRNRKPFGFAYKTEIGSDKKMNNDPFIGYNYGGRAGSEEIILHNLPIFRTNLEGRAEMYNAEGNRWVMLKIPGDVLAKTGRRALDVINAVAKPIPNSDDKFIRIKLPAQIKDGCVRKPFIQVAAVGKYDSGIHKKKLTYDVSWILNRGNGDIVDSLLRSAVATSIGARLVKIHSRPGCGGVIPVLYLTSIDLANVSDFRVADNYPFDGTEFIKHRMLENIDQESDRPVAVILDSENYCVGVPHVSKKQREKMTLNVQEVKNMSRNFEKVVVNGPATIAWINGKKIMVKKSEEDPYDYEKAMLALMVKSFFGDEARFHRWCRDNMKLINKAVEKEAKISAEKAAKFIYDDPAPNPKKSHKPERHDRWTREELDFLLNNYKTMTAKDIADGLGRSVFSVRTQAKNLHLKKR